MSLPIVWRVEARRDLLEIYDWIAQRAGAEIAFGYTAAIEQYLGTLSTLPGWGSPRDDLAPGVRTLAYRRRTTIAYLARDDQIEIIHLAHGGRDLVRQFSADDD